MLQPVQQPGVTPVGAPGTTPLRPPGIAADPNDHRDIRDYNPPDPDIAKGKSKGKGKGKGKKGQGQGPGKGKGKPKGKEDRSPPPLLPLYMPQQPKGKARNNHTTQPPLLQGRPRIAKPRMMEENGAKKRTAHTGSFRQQTQRTRGDAKKTMLRNCLGYFKESMQS